MILACMQHAETKAHSVSHAQAVASAVQESTGLDLPLSRIGASGNHPQNMERDFMRMVDATTQFHVRPTYVPTPIRSRDGVEIISNWPCLAPHEYFAALACAGKLGDLHDGAVDRFWEAARAEPWAQGHPVYDDNHRLQYTIPIRLHGDEAQTHKKQNVGHLVLCGT